MAEIRITKTPEAIHTGVRAKTICIDQSKSMCFFSARKFGDGLLSVFVKKLKERRCLCRARNLCKTIIEFTNPYSAKKSVLKENGNIEYIRSTKIYEERRCEAWR